jgi:RNA polymerase sigma-54 factor
MALENRLDLKLSQKLILTPQLQQAIKLLQMPQLELSQVLNTELIENPFLEEVVVEPEPEEYPNEIELPSPAPDDAEMPFENLINFGADDYFDERGSDGRDLGYFSGGVEEQPSFELFYSKQPGLYDHLLWQLRLSDSNDDIRKTAEVVICNLDEDGYLRSSDEELAGLSGSDPETVAAAVTLVQSFDPGGIGARGLQECLLLQLKTLQLDGTLVEKIVMNNLDELQKKKYGAVAKQYGLPPEDVNAAVKIIEGLEPRPGRAFSSGDVSYIVPDVYINRTEEGFQIAVNEDGMPKLRLNNTYKKLLLRKDSLTIEEREFLKEKLRLAAELLKSLDQRNRTIYRVSASILKFQMEFFQDGHQYVKPLNLKDVAADISMHESTISRVTSNKFLACSHGVFAFRYFFSSALKSDAGDVSSTIVKELIRNIIAVEDAAQPLSDQLIADRLTSQNIGIARRTVAKYREELRIPPQNRRKRYD